MNPPKNRTVELHGEIDDALANTVIAQILFFQMQDSEAPMTIDIDSAGGSVTASLAILDTMEFVKPPVCTRCRTSASGMALLILASGRKGWRTAHHDAHFQMVRLRVREAESTPKSQMMFERLTQRVVSLFAATSGKPEWEVTTQMEDETALSAAGLLAFGMIDRVES